LDIRTEASCIVATAVRELLELLPRGGDSVLAVGGELSPSQVYTQAVEDSSLAGARRRAKPEDVTGAICVKLRRAPLHLLHVALASRRELKLVAQQTRPETTIAHRDPGTESGSIV